MLKQTFLILTGLLLIPQVAYAERWFEVEIYLFERSSGQIQELAPEHVVQPQTKDAVDLITAVINPNAHTGPLSSDCLDSDVSHTGYEDAASEVYTASTEITADSEASARPCIEQASSVTHISQIPVNIAAATPQHGRVGGSAVLLSQSQGQFGDIINKLSRNGYKGLLHMTWQQAMLPRRSAIPVRLFAGHDFGAAYEADGNPILTPTTHAASYNNLIPHYDAHGNLVATPTSTGDDAVNQIQASSVLPSAPIASFDSDGNLLSMPLFASNSMDNHLGLFAANSAPVVHQAVWELDGTIKIYLDHYLYVETALNLREEGTKNVTVLQDLSRVESDPEIITTPFLFAYPMTQNRRLRSGEIHYFDHPRMGMVLQIRKIVNTADSGETDGITSMAQPAE